MTLQSIRENIDTIDQEILQLLAQRFRFAVETKQFKKSVCDPEREQEIRERARKIAPTLSPMFLEQYLTIVFAEAKRLQEVRDTSCSHSG